MPEARINRAANAAAEPPHPLNGNRALQDSASHRHRLPACHLAPPNTASTRPSVNTVGVEEARCRRNERKILLAKSVRRKSVESYAFWLAEPWLIVLAAHALRSAATRQPTKVGHSVSL